jgi:ferritin-like metal-binding protein YciE
MSALRELLIDELKDLYDAEHQLLKALPKMAKAAEHEELKTAFESHLEETKGHVEKLDSAFEALNETPKRKKCKAMEGIIAEGHELLEEGDAALIAAAQKVEHYEIASYGTVAAWADLLGESDAAEFLGEILDEEKAADQKLTEVAESVVNAEETEDAEAVEK